MAAVNVVMSKATFCWTVNYNQPLKLHMHGVHVAQPDTTSSPAVSGEVWAAAHTAGKHRAKVENCCMNKKTWTSPLLHTQTYLGACVHMHPHTHVCAHTRTHTSVLWSIMEGFYVLWSYASHMKETLQRCALLCSPGPSFLLSTSLPRSKSSPLVSPSHLPPKPPKPRCLSLLAFTFFLWNCPLTVFFPLLSHSHPPLQFSWPPRLFFFFLSLSAVTSTSSWLSCRSGLLLLGPCPHFCGYFPCTLGFPPPGSTSFSWLFKHTNKHSHE